MLEDVKVSSCRVLSQLGRYLSISVIQSEFKMAELVIKVDLNDEVIFINKLFNHHVIHID